MSLPEKRMLLDHSTSYDAPVFTALMRMCAVVAMPLVFIAVFVVWSGSLPRQIAAAGAMICLVVLAQFRQKFHALLLTMVFLSQFNLSLHSFALDPPVKLQILFSDVVLFALVCVAIERRARFKLDLVGWLLLALCLWFGVTAWTSVHPHRSIVFLVVQLVRRLKKWHIRVADFKVQVLGFGVGFPGILTGPSGSAKVAV